MRLIEPNNIRVLIFMPVKRSFFSLVVYVNWFWYSLFNAVTLIFSTKITIKRSFYLRIKIKLIDKVDCKIRSIMTNIQAEKERFLNMPVEEKRKLYLVKQYQEPKYITTWAEQYVQNKESLKAEFHKNENEFKRYLTDKFSVDNILNKKIALWSGDITQLEIGAIVNAANNSLLGGGGVDGAIHRAAGPLLKQECATLNGCKTGDAKITCGYKLPAKHVIHTVGPRGEKPDLLKSCYKTSLRLVLENNIKIVAFPCISTGVYDYPQISACSVALQTVRNFLEQSADEVDLVIFVLFLEEDIRIYRNLAQIYFPVE